MKRSQPDDDDPESYVSPTFYPTKKELNILADAMKYEILAKRTKDMTVENIVKDAMQKREAIKMYERIPQDVLKLISLYIDMTTLLELAKKDALFASLLTNNEFWKKRYYKDFPEVENLNLPLSEKFKNNYFVVRYWITKSRQYIFSDEIAQFNVSDGVMLRLNYEKKRQKVLIRTFVKMSQIGSVNEIDFDDYFSSKYDKIRNKYFECKRNNYIEKFITSTYSTDDNSLFYKHKLSYDEHVKYTDKYFFLAYLAIKDDTRYRQYMRYFEGTDLYIKSFKEGFALKKDGIPVIGYSVF